MKSMATLLGTLVLGFSLSAHAEQAAQDGAKKTDALPVVPHGTPTGNTGDVGDATPKCGVVNNRLQSTDAALRSIVPSEEGRAQVPPLARTILQLVSDTRKCTEGGQQAFAECFVKSVQGYAQTVLAGVTGKVNGQQNPQLVNRLVSEYLKPEKLTYAHLAVEEWHTNEIAMSHHFRTMKHLYDLDTSLLQRRSPSEAQVRSIIERYLADQTTKVPRGEMAFRELRHLEPLGEIYLANPDQRELITSALSDAVQAMPYGLPFDRGHRANADMLIASPFANRAKVVNALKSGKVGQWITGAIEWIKDASQRVASQQPAPTTQAELNP